MLDLDCGIALVLCLAGRFPRREWLALATLLKDVVEARGLPDVSIEGSSAKCQGIRGRFIAFESRNFDRTRKCSRPT